MAYCTVAGVISVLSEAETARLTDDDAGNVVNDVVINEAITSGDALIDGYLRNRYVLPLSEAPKLITDISVRLAVYFLHARRYAKDMPESIENSYKNQVKLLEQIQKGYLSLGVEQKSTPTSQTGGVRINKTAADRVFPKALMDKF